MFVLYALGCGVGGGGKSPQCGAAFRHRFFLLFVREPHPGDQIDTATRVRCFVIGFRHC